MPDPNDPLFNDSLNPGPAPAASPDEIENAFADEQPDVQTPAAPVAREIGDRVTVCWVNDEDRPHTAAEGRISAINDDCTISVTLDNGVELVNVGPEYPGVSPYYM